MSRRLETSSPPESSHAPVAHYGVRFAGGAGVLIGGFWLVAWLVGVASRWSAAGVLTPKANLSLAALLAGAALLLVSPGTGTRWHRTAGALLAGVVLLIGSLTFSEHLLHYSFGIDQLLATEAPGAVATASPNRMGPPASMSLTLLGIGLLLLARRKRTIAPYLGLAVFIINLVPAVGYTYGIDALYGKAQLTGIAWPTVIALMSLGVGLMLACPASGPIAMLLRRDPGGVLLRRLLPAALVVPLVLGFLTVQARHRGLLDRATAIGLLVIALALIFSSLLWRSAAHLSRSASAEANVNKELVRQATFPRLNPYPITELDAAGRVSFLNPAAEELFPDLRERGLAHPWLTDWDSVVTAVREQGAKVQVRDIAVGSTHYLQTIHYLAETECIRIYGLDITERKRAERELQKLNRTLRAINNSNQTLLHATNELDLLRDVCRIVTQDCGYGMVWVGYAEQDADKTVRPVAHSEVDAGYLEGVRITWADAERGRGPAGTAIRTARPSVCRDMRADTAFAPWREEALKRGFASAIGLPLMSDGKPFGVLTIYSRERGAFTNEEVELLSELAGDLSYGIGALRMRVAHAQADKALRESEAEFRNLANAIPQLCWMADADGWIFWYNQRWYEYTGTTPEQMQGWGWQSVHDPEILPTVLERWKASIASGQSFEMVFPLRGADGALRPFLTRVMPVRNAEGKVARWFGTNTDVTELRNAQEAVRQSGERFAAVVGSAMDAIITVDQEQRIIMFNAAAEKTFKVQAGQAVGQTLDQFIPERFREIHRKHISNFGATGVTSRTMQSPGTLYGRRSDGQEFPMEATISQVRTGPQKLYTVILRDITQRKQTEEVLMRSEKLATVGRLAATIAHEINNPLSALSGVLYLLKSDDSISPTSRQYLELAEVEVQRAGQIANTTLGLSKQGGLPAKFRPAEILDGVAALVSRKVEGKGVRIEKAYRAEQLEVLGVAGEIRQVLWNLMSNAVDAITGDGRVIVRVCESVDWRRPAVRGARFTIADTGSGIPPDALRHIFEPFFTTKHTGTGLGLWVTSEIIHKHGGSIKVRSRKEPTQHGTVFSIFIPAEGQNVDGTSTSVQHDGAIKPAV